MRYVVEHVPVVEVIVADCISRETVMVQVGFTPRRVFEECLERMPGKDATFLYDGARVELDDNNVFCKDGRKHCLQVVQLRG